MASVRESDFEITNCSSVPEENNDSDHEDSGEESHEKVLDITRRQSLMVLEMDDDEAEVHLERHFSFARPNSSGPPTSESTDSVTPKPSKPSIPNLSLSSLASSSEPSVDQPHVAPSQSESLTSPSLHIDLSSVAVSTPVLNSVIEASPEGSSRIEDAPLTGRDSVVSNISGSEADQGDNSDAGTGLSVSEWIEEGHRRIREKKREQRKKVVMERKSSRLSMERTQSSSSKGYDRTLSSTSSILDVFSGSMSSPRSSGRNTDGFPPPRPQSSRTVSQASHASSSALEEFGFSESPRIDSAFRITVVGGVGVITSRTPSPCSAAASTSASPAAVTTTTTTVHEGRKIDFSHGDKDTDKGENEDEGKEISQKEKQHADHSHDDDHHNRHSHGKHYEQHRKHKEHHHHHSPRRSETSADSPTTSHDKQSNKQVFEPPLESNAKGGERIHAVDKASPAGIMDCTYDLCKLM